MNILLAIDHSACSESAVLALREQYRTDHAVVRVVHVVEWPRNLPPMLAFAEGPHTADCILEAQSNLHRSGEKLVEHAASQLRAVGFDATTCVVEGEPRRTILEMAAAWPADTIVLGSHGRKGYDRLLLGSVSDSVVRHAQCSVAVIRGRHATLIETPRPDAFRPRAFRAHRTTMTQGLYPPPRGLAVFGMSPVV
jgi:nucleotide-binding universal stress UspA family protein